jgi:Type III restriction enzyme, res subunit
VSLRPLRPHQERGVSELRRSLASGRKRPMLQAPTGFGKTLLAAHIVAGALRTASNSCRSSAPSARRCWPTRLRNARPAARRSSPSRRYMRLEGELVELDSRKSGARKATLDDKEQFYRELKWIQREKGHKSGWCWHKYQDRFKGERPPKWFEMLTPREPSISSRNWLKSRAIAFANRRAA